MSTITEVTDMSVFVYFCHLRELYILEVKLVRTVEYIILHLCVYLYNKLSHLTLKTNAIHKISTNLIDLSHALDFYVINQLTLLMGGFLKCKSHKYLSFKTPCKKANCVRINFTAIVCEHADAFPETQNHKCSFYLLV